MSRNYYRHLIEGGAVPILPGDPIGTLRHQYNFEESDPASFDVIDSVGTINGTRDGATINVNGFNGKAYLYDGVDDIVTFPNNLGINGFPFTVSFNIKKTNSSDRITAINGRTSANYLGFDIDIRSNAIFVGYGNGGGRVLANRRSFVNTSAGINDTNFHKIMVNFVSINEIILYVDETEYEMTFHSGSTDPNFQVDFNCTYKLMVDLSDFDYNSGILDEVKIYY